MQLFIKERKPAELEKKIILSTTKSAGAAMDIKGLVETVNLAVSWHPRKELIRRLRRNSSGRLVVKTPNANAGCVGSISGWGTKISHTTEYSQN